MQILLRDLILRRLKFLSEDKKTLAIDNDEGKFWGVCYQVDEYIESITKEVFFAEDWITQTQQKTTYKLWLRESKDEGTYTSFYNKNSWKNDSRQTLCFLLYQELLLKPNLFLEEIQVDLKHFREVEKDFNHVV